MLGCCVSIFSCDAGLAISRAYAYVYACIVPPTQEQLDDQLDDAIRGRDLVGVQRAIAHGANIHVDNDWAVRYTAIYDDIDIVKYLLELPEGQRADVHAEDDWALRNAAGWHNWDIVACLLQHGADRTKLSPAQLEELHNSRPAQAYIASQIQNALDNEDISTVENLLSIIPLEKFPEDLQKQIGNL